jgi:MFS family permease
VLQVIATGMLTVVMGQSVLGRRVTTAQAWQRTKPRIWALFGVTILIGLIVGGAFIGGLLLAVLVGVGLANAGDPAVGVLVGLPLGILSFLLGVWLYVKLLLAPSALMLERAAVVESMRRASRLVKGAWWRTFGIYLLAYILVQIISTVLSFPLGIVAGILPIWLGEDSFALAYAASTALAVLLTSIITLPFLAGVTSLLYIDRRIRREALDLELQRAAGTGV